MPKEEWVNQDAGLHGRGGSCYINGVVLRNKDANTAWTSASDGTLEERIQLCQNRRGDVSALVYASGDLVEQIRYSPYGTPFGLPGGDTDSDGDCDATDVTQIQTWIDAPAYDVRGDIELDGDVDATDKSIVQASYQSLTLGRGKLSSFGSKRGWAGYSKAVAADWFDARNRHISASLGRWGERDPLEYVDGANIYVYVESSPMIRNDPLGLEWTWCTTCWFGECITYPCWVNRTPKCPKGYKKHYCEAGCHELQGVEKCLCEAEADYDQDVDDCEAKYYEDLVDSILAKSVAGFGAGTIAGSVTGPAGTVTGGTIGTVTGGVVGAFDGAYKASKAMWGCLQDAAEAWSDAISACMQ